MLEKQIIRLNNLSVKLRRKRSAAGGILLLFPHCLQNSKCAQNISSDLKLCKRCGKCKVKDVLELAEEIGVQCAVATGGRLAVERVKEDRVHAVVAVACEKELSQGIKGAFPKAILAVPNLRPKGPCKDTDVNLAEVRKAIQWLLRQ
jgi:hypothetical protein